MKNNILIILIFAVLFSALSFSGCIEDKKEVMYDDSHLGFNESKMKINNPPQNEQVIPTPAPVIIVTPKKEVVNYISDVDEVHGFYNALRTNGSSNYKNKILIINENDNVKWVSMTHDDYYLTIVSADGLWNNSSSLLKYTYRSFNYTFNNHGNYTIYVKEFPNLRQTIIVQN